jgi:hypothetical protein
MRSERRHEGTTMSENREVFHVIRFRNPVEAARVASDVHELIASWQGHAFRSGELRAVVIKPEGAPWETVLYFTKGAIGAARLAGIRLPIPEGTISFEQATRGAVLAGLTSEVPEYHAAQPA